MTSSDGIALHGATLIVPPLNIKKDWYDGLDGPGLDASLSLHMRGPRSLLQFNSRAPPPQPTAVRFFREFSQKFQEEDDHEEFVENPKPTKSKTNSAPEAKVFQGIEAWLPAEAIESFDVIQNST